MTEPKTEKAAGRTSTLLSATVSQVEGDSQAFVRNISEMGALIESDAGLATDEIIVLRRGNLEVEGYVVWAKDHTYGIKFHSIINPAIWTCETPSDETNISPSSSLKQLIDDGGDISTLIEKRLSEELLYATRFLENVGDILAKDAFLCSRYTLQLQYISIAVQMLIEINQILVADNKLDEIQKRVTGPMKARLLR